MKKTLTFIAAAFAMAGIMTFSMHSASAATYARQLDLGAAGFDVSQLQTFLAIDPTLYPERLVTGYFGQLTASAVARFQARYSIPAVGRVGPVTLAKLNELNTGGIPSFDRVAPIISNVDVDTDSSSATVSFTTAAPAMGRVYYATQPISMLEASSGTRITINAPYIGEATMTTSHSVTVPSLSGNTTYYYVVYAADGNGNESIVLQSTLRTE